MRTFLAALAALTLTLSSCASESREEAKAPEQEFFVETEEREAPEPREPEGPAVATDTGSSVYRPPSSPVEEPVPEEPVPEEPVPEEPVPEEPVSDDPYYRPPGMDPCEEDAHGLVDNDACLEQNGFPRDG